MTEELYRVEEWYISGVHTGYRVVRGHGFLLDLGGGFTADRYRPGSFELAKAQAEDRCEKLNSGELVDE